MSDSEAIHKYLMEAEVWKRETKELKDYEKFD